jgi:hypothetical protein
MTGPWDRTARPGDRTSRARDSVTWPGDRVTTGEQRGVADRVARALTDVLSPGVLVVVVVVATASARAESAAQAWVAAAIGAVAGAVIPLAFIARGVRRGRWTDHHVRERAHRPWPLAVALISGVAGTALLLLTGAEAVVAAGAAGMSALAIATAVTIGLRWKLSIHAVAAAGSAAILTILFGPTLVASWPIAAAIAWSRVRLGDHTRAQACVGLVVGAVVMGAVFALLS